MGASKSQLFSFSQNELANMSKVLAHPARIAILEVLANKKSCICNDIVEEIPLAQPTISQHLKELKNIGLIKGNIEGTSICYCLDIDAVAKIKARISGYFELLESGNGCC